MEPCCALDDPPESVRLCGTETYGYGYAVGPDAVAGVVSEPPPLPLSAYGSNGLPSCCACCSALLLPL
jgi:hypothetical protein